MYLLNECYTMFVLGGRPGKGGNKLSADLVVDNYCALHESKCEPGWLDHLLPREKGFCSSFASPFCFVLSPLPAALRGQSLARWVPSQSMHACRKMHADSSHALPQFHLIFGWVCGLGMDVVSSPPSWTGMHLLRPPPLEPSCNFCAPCCHSPRKMDAPRPG